ncbi:MAG: glycosyltransferase family 2 protein [Brevundimonas sp.]
MISVILPTRNRAHILPAAIGALDDAAFGHSVEVLVVDNGSTDATKKIVTSLAPKNIALLYLVEPIAGVCRAKNRGIRTAVGDLLVFTDDDCQVSLGYFNDLVAHYSDSTVPMILGGRVELGDPTDAAITIKTDDEPAQLGEDQHPGGFIHGCNLTMSRSVLDKIGLWDEDFGPGARFIAAEETELNYRAHKAGIPVHYVPDMVTRHFHGRKTLDDVKRLNWQYQVGNGALLAKHADRTLLKHLYWYARNWAKEFVGGPLFDKTLNLSHRELVLGQIVGSARYWTSRMRRSF